MRVLKILGLFGFFLAFLSVNAQTLPVFWSTYSYSQNSLGGIYSVDNTGNNLVQQYQFQLLDGDLPQYSQFIQASDGKMYGMTFNGGGNGAGLLFSLDTDLANDYVNLYSFAATGGGGFPSGSLLQASNGYLYGMTNTEINNGAIFKYNINTKAYSTIYTFTNATGNTPFGSLMQANDGKLYGMASAGGTYGNGVIFSFDPTNNTYTDLFNFNDTLGALPYGNLIQANNGKLYGMTSLGGANVHAGVIFSWDIANRTYTKLHDFDSVTIRPYGSLLQASDGMFYGTCYQGGIFRFDTAGNIFTAILDTAGEGLYFESNLVQAPNGKIYGTAERGGIFTMGMVFSYDPANGSYADVFDFDDSVGAVPQGGLCLAGNGKLYGMTNIGGRHTTGVIYSIDPVTNKFTLIDALGTADLGSTPYSNPTQGFDNKLYGLTLNGGLYDAGEIYRFDPFTQKLQRLFSFKDTLGTAPNSNLLQYHNGIMYGLASGGGKFGFGALFSFDPVTLAYKKLLDSDSAHGIDPYSSLTEASNNKIYGTFSQGGSYGKGVLFSYEPTNEIYNVVHSFTDSTGIIPYSDVIQGPDGKLYGMTNQGGASGKGVIYSFDLTSGAYQKLFDFHDTLGANPYMGFMLGKDGKLYAMTYIGGTGNVGVIFSFDCRTQTYTKLIDFNSNIGEYPWGKLMQASDSNLYGITISGVNLKGDIIEYNMHTHVAQDIFDFQSATGLQPQYAGLVELKTYNRISQTVCPGSSYNFNGKLLTAPGFYNDTLMGANGLDSIVILQLTLGVTNYTNVPDTICQGSTITFNGSILDSSGIYVDTLTSTTGCDSIVTLSLIVQSTQTQQLCAVTIDTSLNKALAIWNKTNKYAIDSFFIYRADSTGSSYNLAGAVNRDSLSEFLDLSSMPDSMSYRYKIAVKDTCGNLGPLSNYIQTLYLRAYGTGNFVWTPYLVENNLSPIISYNFYRDNLGDGNWQLLASLTSNQTSATDSNYASYPNAGYKVVAVLSQSCNPTRAINEISSNTLSRVIFAGIEANIINGIRILNNPVHNNITLVNINGPVKIELMDDLGRELQPIVETSGSTFGMSMEKYAAGVYLIQVVGGDYSKTIKVFKY